MEKCVVIDYGLGNLYSVHNALLKSASDVSHSIQIEMSSDPDKILAADRIVFPGVGAIRDCMKGLRERELVDVVVEVFQQKPALAICIGMQALAEFSAENDGISCLGMVPTKVTRFAADPSHLRKIPHMGWNEVIQKNTHPLWEYIPNRSRFYFVHSYRMQASSEFELAATEYGESFSAAIGADNWCGVQFHPEKSQKHGLQLLTNFLGWRP